MIATREYEDRLFTANLHIDAATTAKALKEPPPVREYETPEGVNPDAYRHAVSGSQRLSKLKSKPWASQGR